MMLVGLLPILIAAFLSIYSVTLSHRIDVANLENALIEQKYNEIEDFIAGAEGGIKTYVPFPVTLESVDMDGVKIGAIAAMNSHQELQEFAWLNTSGTEAFVINRKNPSGIAGSDLKDESQSEAFLAAIKGDDYVSPLYFTANVPMMTVAFPVLNSEKKIISVTRGEISLAGIQAILKNVSLGNSGYLYLVDGKGVLVGGGLRVPLYTFVGNIGIVSETVNGMDFLGADGQRRYKNYFGEEVVAAGKYLPDFKLGLIAEWPAKEADASVNDLMYKDVAVSAFVLFAVIIASIALAVVIVRPVRKLEEGTRLVAEGKFDESVDIKSGDELEELGQAFNKMIAGLKQLQQLKDEFVFIAAHELRTPVAAMKGYLTLIRDGLTGPITDKTKEFVNKVINSNQRLIQLVNDLLDVSRSEAGRLMIKVSPVDITEAIDSALGELKSLADQNKTEMLYEIPENIPKVMADSERLKEIIVNLVGNSIKYSDPGGRVIITHEIYGDNLITRVKDTGFGISKEAQTKLFQKFYRVQTDQTKGITGTGLGLFIVRETVEKMGGTIWAESAGEGKGSTFTFSLQVAPPENKKSTDNSAG